MRNSSLVEKTCAENVTGLKHDTEPPHAFALGRVFPFPGFLILLRPHTSDYVQYRNINLLSIDYDFRPRLRPRLTLRRLALLRKP